MNFRVLHCPTNVGNQPWVLSRYEREVGLDSDLVVNYGTWLGYPADKVLGRQGKRTIYDVLRRFLFGFSAPLRYDALHYYFGRSLLYWDDWPALPGWPFLDLKMAKALGKPVFMTLQGCDIRVAAESNRLCRYTPCAKGACEVYETCLSNYDAKRVFLAEKVLPLCDKVFYLNPELGHYVKKGHFLPYSNVDLSAINVVCRPDTARSVPKIVHAPSNGPIKGTPLILEALERLKEHFDFELILVQGLPHEQAMEIYRDADLAIDQVLAGWYGGVAVEWMAMGTPVLSYIREQDLGFVPSSMREELPIRNIRPDRLLEDLIKIFRRRAEWRAWGRASRKYVERWHNPKIIAGAMSDAYRNPAKAWDLESYLNTVAGAN